MGIPYQFTKVSHMTSLELDEIRYVSNPSGPMYRIYSNNSHPRIVAVVNYIHSAMSYGGHARSYTYVRTQLLCVRACARYVLARGNSSRPRLVYSRTKESAKLIVAAATIRINNVVIQNNFTFIACMASQKWLIKILRFLLYVYLSPFKLS